MTSLKICVGSLKPVKFQATKEAFSNYFSDFELFKFNANSKVSDQPIGKENIIMGALNRAEQSLHFLIKKEILTQAVVCALLPLVNKTLYNL